MLYISPILARDTSLKFTLVLVVPNSFQEVSPGFCCFPDDTFDIVRLRYLKDKSKERIIELKSSEDGKKELWVRSLQAQFPEEAANIAK